MVPMQLAYANSVPRLDFGQQARSRARGPRLRACLLACLQDSTEKLKSSAAAARS